MFELILVVITIALWGIDFKWLYKWHHFRLFVIGNVLIAASILLFFRYSALHILDGSGDFDLRRLLLLVCAILSQAAAIFIFGLYMSEEGRNNLANGVAASFNNDRLSSNES